MASCLKMKRGLDSWQYHFKHLNIYVLLYVCICVHMYLHASGIWRFLWKPEDIRLLRNRIVNSLLRVVEIEPGSSWRAVSFLNNYAFSPTPPHFFFLFVIIWGCCLCNGFEKESIIFILRALKKFSLLLKVVWPLLPIGIYTKVSWSSVGFCCNSLYECKEATDLDGLRDTSTSTGPKAFWSPLNFIFPTTPIFTNPLKCYALFIALHLHSCLNVYMCVCVLAAQFIQVHLGQQE